MYQKLIIDAPYLAHRSYLAPYDLSTKHGNSSTMIHGFLNSLNSLNRKFKPGVIEVAWESHGTKSWRRKIYPDYKPSKGVEEDFIEQLKSIQVFLYLIDLKQFYSPHNEADDVIAKLIDNQNNLIFTSDKDIFQLIDSNTHIYDGKKIYTEKDAIKKFGIKPKQIPDYLAIKGDKSDNIPGLDGYGPKKSVKAIKEFNTMENWIDNQNFDKSTEQLLKMNKTLVTLNKNCHLKELTFDDNRTPEDILDEYDLKRLKTKIEELRLLGSQKDSLEEFF